MSNDAVAIAAIVMLGVLLSVIAWQLLAIARTAVGRDKSAQTERFHHRLQALEALHEDNSNLDHESGQR